MRCKAGSRHAGGDVRTVLLADDDRELLSFLSEILHDEGFSVVEAADGRSALDSFRHGKVDAVLLDLKMPHVDGMETMREMFRMDKNAQIVILTAHGDMEMAVQAVKEGAYDFMEKPPDYGKLVLTLRRATERHALERTVRKTRTALDLSMEERFGKSAAMRKAIRQIESVADTDISVVIQGETGTGKSYVAYTIHNLSSRVRKPFVRVDIGLIPDPLIESELFGHKAGAFTGAAGSRKGYFKEADGGTLFIDDLENMSPSIQQKLLTVVDEKKIHQLGQSSPTSVDVRIIAATNKDLVACVARGEVRSDLYYRFGEFVITLPPLRERKEDISYFANRFLFDVCAEIKRPLPDLDKEVLELLCRHAWPGNLRELRNVMRKVALASRAGQVDETLVRSVLSEQMPLEISRPFTSSLRGTLRDVEEKMIQLALERTKGNKSQAAGLLKISYPTLLSKIKEYHKK